MDSLAYLHLALAYQDPTSPELVLRKSIQQFWQQWLAKPISSRFILRLLSVATALTILTLAQAALALLQFGDVGADVSQLQLNLQQLGYYRGPISGTFDGFTEQAVIDFQRDAGLRIDGIVGQNTERAINESLAAIFRTPFQQPFIQPVQPFAAPPPPPNFNNFSNFAPTVSNRSFQTFGGTNRLLRRGDRGEDVRALQSLLRSNGFNPGPIDGIYGQLTENAVYEFQFFRGLPANGIADAGTIQALLGGEGNNIAIPQFTPKGYVVIIPTGDITLVGRVQRFNSNAQLYRNRRGRYIYVDTYPNRARAESESALLRSRGFTNARVVYFR